jgi:putative proteasome-type protease
MMFDVAMLVADAMRDIERRDGESLQENEIGFNTSFIVIIDNRRSERAKCP